MPESEADFLQSVLELAKLKGWLCFHSYDSRKSCGAGFPDLCMVRISRLVYAELKSEKGKVTTAQQEWLSALEATGKCEVYTWKSSEVGGLMEVLK